MADTLATVIGVVGAALLHGALWTAPLARLSTTQFGGTHGWAFDRMARMLAFEISPVAYTSDVSFPDIVYAAHIAWVPGLLAAPMSWATGPLGGLNLAVLLAPALGVPMVSALARAWTRADPVACASAGLLVVLSPPAIGAFANGQVCKAQLWALVALPLATTWAARGKSGVAWAAVLAVASTFTEPTYALLGALVSLPLGLWSAWRDRDRGALLRVLAAGLAMGAVFLGARGYYDPPTRGLYLPAAPVPLSWFAAYVHEVATPATLLWGREYVTADDAAAHVDYLGGFALVALGLASWRTRGARAVVLILVATGITLSLGEWLVTLDGPVLVGDRLIALPARALAALGFPFARSGQYYRALGLAWVGVALACAALGRRAGPALCALILADGLRATSGLWPVPSAPFPGLRCLTPVSRQVGEEATWTKTCGDRGGECGEIVRHERGGEWRLDLPRARRMFDVGVRGLATAIDGLPTSDPPAADAPPRPADELARVLAGLDHDPAMTLLQARGVLRVVAWRDDGTEMLRDATRALGPPSCSDGEMRTWDIPRAKSPE